MANGQETSVPQGEGLSVVQRIIGVFTSPRPTMDDIAARPSWLVPLLIVVLVAMISGYFVQDLVVQMSAEQARERMMQNPGMTEEQMQQALQQMSTFTRLSAWAGPLVFTPIVFLIIAGILLMTGNVFLGGEGKFKQVFSVVCWSSVVTVLSSIINVPIMKSRGVLNPATNLTFLAPNAEMQSATYFVLSQLDLFYVWWVAVMGIGVAAVYKFSNQKGITIVAAWWLLYIVVNLAFRAIF